MDLSLDEIGEHLLRRHLVVEGRVALQLLDGEGVVDDMGMVDEGVLHEHVNPVAEELLVVVPDNGIVIHRHTGVEGVVDEGVTDRLYIGAIGPDMVVGVDLAVDGVGLDVKGDNFQRIGMHKEGVTLRIVDGHRRVGTERIAGVLPVFTVVAGHLVLVDRVNIDDITEGLAEAQFTVVVDTVAHHRLALVLEHRTVHEDGLVFVRVVIALFGIDGAIAGGDM